MLETLIGFISGIVSGTGMGGGTILILCLSIFLGINQKTAGGYKWKYKEDIAYKF